MVHGFHAPHFFLLTSRTEGRQRFLLEAQPRGCPLIATDVGGVVDIVGNGRSGSWYPRGPGGADGASA